MTSACRTTASARIHHKTRYSGLPDLSDARRGQQKSFDAGLARSTTACEPALHPRSKLELFAGHRPRCSVRDIARYRIGVPGGGHETGAASVNIPQHLLSIIIDSGDLRDIHNNLSSLQNRRQGFQRLFELSRILSLNFSQQAEQHGSSAVVKVDSQHLHPIRCRGPG